MTSAPKIIRRFSLATMALSLSVAISVALSSTSDYAAAKAAEIETKTDTANTATDWKSKEEQAETSFIAGNYSEAEKQWQEA
ncbi:MAG: hypothetical protein QG574_55, partial [Cyanobacteriota bacterium erpe_2018_sw_21hr_WHONDRS-SW48-000092_B_bin.40]|nr:hypothetical protein [Cyanobacteriota bacterium erpe_2018_sw_21hr_WHONDRS-SW48-000092_B_bin.40]